MRITFILLAFIFIGCQNQQKQDLPDPYEAGWEGERVCEILEDNDELRVLRCSFPPGVGHEKHTHQPHFGYTIVGGKFKIEDQDGTREVDIPDNYSWSNDSLNTHQVQNIGNTTAVFLIVEYK